MFGRSWKIPSSLTTSLTSPTRLLAAWLLTAWAVVGGPVFSADVIYKYVDDKGVPFFTDNYQQIPARYLERVHVLDAVTLQPVTPTENASAASSPLSTPAVRDVPQTQGSETSPQTTNAWLDRLAKQRIPLLTRFQLGIGLTSLTLIVGAILAIRASRNPVLTLLLRASIMFILGGTVYALYLSGLNERVSRATNEPTGRTTSGQEILGDVKGTAGQVKQLLDKTALDPVKAAIADTKAATVGEAARTVTEANQANQRLDKRLREIESAP